jgi:membrane-associated phospholipid phosphatase
MMWTATAIASGIAMLACYLSGLTLSPDSANAFALYALVVAIALYLDPFKFGRLAVAADALVLFTIVCIVGAVASYVAMKQSGPLTDGLLDRADRAMGFNWLAIRAWIDQYPILLSVLGNAYRSCGPMPAIIMVLLCASGRAEHCYRFIRIFSVALIVTMGVAFFFPAIAAFAFYDYSPLPANAAYYGQIIDGLRDGSLTAIDIHDLGGIVTFPSFHATMAILFGWALWPIRRARAVVLIVNSLMWVSAVPIGGHYVVDIIGGSVVAILAIRIAGGAQGRSPSSSRLQTTVALDDRAPQLSLSK